MAQSPEVEVLVAIAAVLTTGLANIPPGDWAYHRPPVVRRAPIPPAGTQMKPADCPVVYVVPGQGSMLSPGSYDVDTKRVAYRYDFNVDLIGIVFREGAADVRADDERLNLRSHLMHILHENRHLEGAGFRLSKDGIIVGGRPEFVDESEFAPAMVVGLPLTIPLAQSYATVVA